MTAALSRPLAASAVPPGGVEREVATRPAERAAIAAEFGLLELRHLSADIAARRSGDHVALVGRIRAELVQSCVVTLVTVVQAIDEPFEQRFTRGGAAAAPLEVLVELAPGDPDPPDVLTGDSLDLGEVVLEQLALLIDPYPRAPGATFKPPAAKDGDDDASPFAVLKSLGHSSRS